VLNTAFVAICINTNIGFVATFSSTSVLSKTDCNSDLENFLCLSRMFYRVLNQSHSHLSNSRFCASTEALHIILHPENHIYCVCRLRPYHLGPIHTGDKVKFDMVHKVESRHSGQSVSPQSCWLLTFSHFCRCFVESRLSLAHSNKCRTTIFIPSDVVSTLSPIRTH